MHSKLCQAAEIREAEHRAREDQLQQDLLSLEHTIHEQALAHSAELDGLTTALQVSEHKQAEAQNARIAACLRAAVRCMERDRARRNYAHAEDMLEDAKGLLREEAATQASLRAEVAEHQAALFDQREQLVNLQQSCKLLQEQLASARIGENSALEEMSKATQALEHFRSEVLRRVQEARERQGSGVIEFLSESFSQEQPPYVAESPLGGLSPVCAALSNPSLLSLS